MEYVPPGTPDALPNYFGAGKGGFQDGDPTTGVGGTQMPAALFNDILGNLMNIMDVAGIAPTAGRLQDLSDAIIKLVNAGHGQCQLKYTSTTALVLKPYNGNLLKVNGHQYAIPAAGVAIANTNVRVSGVAASNLANSTDYLLYVLDDGAGNLVPDFWPLAGGHMMDTTAGNVGVEVRSNGGVADSTRTLVGMVGTDSGGHFSDADGARLVLGWFNRRGHRSRTSFASASTGSTTPVELASASRNSFLVWSGGEVTWSAGGPVQASDIGGSPYSVLAFDGTGEPEFFQWQACAGGALGSCACAGRKVGLSEGRHYTTVQGAVTIAGSGLWTNFCQTVIVEG